MSRFYPPHLPAMKYVAKNGKKVKAVTLPDLMGSIGLFT